MPNEQNYLLPARVRDAIVNYLGTRPYSEVAQGIGALMSLEAAASVAPPESDEANK